MPSKVDPKRWQYQLPPREKLHTYGANTLTDAELLAIFLRTGIKGTPVIEFAQQLIHQFGSLYHLMNAEYSQFCQVHGLGTAKYAQIKASIELARRFFTSQIHHECALNNPQATRDYLSLLLSEKDREVFIVLFLNIKNEVIHTQELFSGTLNHVEIHPREIVRAALCCNASSIILAHNHPSGHPEPSEADKIMTNAVSKACQLVDIHILDHLVLGKGRYISFAEYGWLPSSS